MIKENKAISIPQISDGTEEKAALCYAKRAFFLRKTGILRRFSEKCNLFENGVLYSRQLYKGLTKKVVLLERWQLRALRLLYYT